MKKYLLFLFVFFGSPLLFSQILIVNSGASVSIASGSSITLAGLEIAPSDTYVISGDNAVSRAATAITSNGNSSVSRVYNTTVMLSGFTGTLTFSYLDGELNDINEDDLVLELQAADDSWTSYTATVDPNANTVSYSFDDAVSFKGVTASAAGASLTLEDIDTSNSIVVYPNPTANRIYIKSTENTTSELFDLVGRKVKSTNQNQMDLSTLGNGAYILNVLTTNKTQSFKILKQ